MRQSHLVVPALVLISSAVALGACGAQSEPTPASTGGAGLATGGTAAAPATGGDGAALGGAGAGTGAVPATGGSGAAPGTGGALPAGGTGSGATPGTGAVPATGAAGSDATGGGAAGSGAAGSGAAGSGAAGSGAAGSGATGSGATGSGAAGSGATGTGAAGSGGTGTGAAGTGAEGTGASGSGAAGSGGSATGGEPGLVYSLPPPDECSNQFNVFDCFAGDSSSVCGGECVNDNGSTSKNACESGKEGVPVQYACPRHMLFSSEMNQAVIDDGFEGAFNYAIVGHDPDPSNLDAGLPNSCCQCYQLVFDVPTYLYLPAITPPPPLIVQSANTAASGALGFDVFMAAGGLGAFNACNADLGMASSFGYSQYTAYPSIGQPGAGGVKPGPDSVNCTGQDGGLSDALIADASCQERLEAACGEISAADPVLEAESRYSCIQSNQAETYYHENWDVYAKRVVCPTHLMEVTGCKIPPEPGLPEADPAVQTTAQAQAAGFSGGYHTTTMQDCCMPTCAWANNVQVETVDGYNSFYSCLDDGTPVTQ